MHKINRQHLKGTNVEMIWPVLLHSSASRHPADDDVANLFSSSFAKCWWNLLITRHVQVDAVLLNSISQSSYFFCLCLVVILLLLLLLVMSHTQRQDREKRERSIHDYMSELTLADDSAPASALLKFKINIAIKIHWSTAETQFPSLPPIRSSSKKRIKEKYFKEIKNKLSNVYSKERAHHQLLDRRNSSEPTAIVDTVYFVISSKDAWLLPADYSGSIALYLCIKKKRWNIICNLLVQLFCHVLCPPLFKIAIVLLAALAEAISIFQGEKVAAFKWTFPFFSPVINNWKNIYVLQLCVLYVIFRKK